MTAAIPPAVVRGMYIAAWARALDVPVVAVSGYIELYARHDPGDEGDDLVEAFVEDHRAVVGVLGWAVPVIVPRRRGLVVFCCPPKTLGRSGAWGGELMALRRPRRRLRRASRRGAAPDELPPASPANTDRADRGADGRFRPGNAVARAQKTRPSKYGSLVLGLAKADSVYQTCARWGARYAAHRRAELAKAHGGELSAGVGALVESAGNALADSRYVRAKAAETGDPALFKLAAALATEARQCELAAWELASREGAARPRAPVDPMAAIRARVAARGGTGQ